MFVNPFILPKLYKEPSEYDNQYSPMGELSCASIFFHVFHDVYEIAL